MTQPTRRPAETQTPQLTEDQVRDRAQRGFDTVISNIIRTQFSQRPGAAEMAAFRPFFDRYESVDAAVRAYVDSLRERDNQSRERGQPATAVSSSLIAKYYEFTGSTGWLLTPTQTLGFIPSILANDVRAVTNDYRGRIANAYVGLYQQSRSDSPSYTYTDLNLVANLGIVGPLLLNGMIGQVNGGPNAVPAFMASETSGNPGSLHLALRESTARVRG